MSDLSAKKISAVPANDVYYGMVNFLNGSSKAMNVNGSVTPAVFQYMPPSDEIWYIESISILMIDDGTSSPTNFGSISALTNGLKLDATSSVTGTPTTKIFTNIKDNIDLVLRFPIGTFVSSATTTLGAPQGFLESFDGHYGIMRFRVPIRLNGTTSDSIQWTVRDNLTNIGTLASCIVGWREY